MSTHVPVNNDQPTLPLTELLVEQGVFPGRSTGNPALDSHLDPGGIPMAAIRTVAGNFNFSGGTEMADGQIKPINANQALFALLGTSFGGDGRTNFQIPDAQGRVLVGTGQGTGLSNEILGQATGADSVTLGLSQMPSSIGGGNAPFDDHQSSLGITYMINTGGHTPDGSTDFVGMVVPTTAGFAGDGYLPAQGQILRIADYPNLFNAIGTSYGGDGTTTFALPDLRGRTIVGFSAQTPVGTYLGGENVTVTTSELPASAGGQGVAIDNHQPSLAMTYLICVAGIYPSQGGGISFSIPFLGEIVAFAGTTAPSGWMIAAGQTLAISQDTALFSLLGTIYGGNGTTTFNLPDLRDHAVVNAGASAALGTINLGQVYGLDSITLLANNIIDPAHDHAPVVTAADVIATPLQNIAASSLFSVTDADNDPITAYQFWDSTNDSTSGLWVIGGFGQPTGQAINVTPSQLAGATFQSRSGSDDLFVRASDGIEWGNWTEFHVNAPIDVGPTVQVASLTASHGQSFAASSLFSNYANQFGPAVYYQFWDTGTGGGHFAIDAVAQAAGENMSFAAQLLSHWSYQSGSGADTLWVRANDGIVWGAWSSAFTVTGPIDVGPAVSVTNLTATHGQAFAGLSLFTNYSDPFGSAATQYDFWNNGTGGGHFMLNGTALAANQDNIITAAQLVQLAYQSGSGADTLWVRANDGTTWGAWSSAFTVTAPLDSGPTVQVANLTASHGQSFAGSALFSNYADPFGSAASYYDFWDLGDGGGQFLLNGAGLAVNGHNIITAAQLAQLTYQTNSGADTLWVRASDGIAWGAWSSAFTVTSPIDAGPTLFVANQTASHGQVIDANDLALYSDPFNSPGTLFDYWDSGTGGGHFVLNGTALATGQANLVTAAQLAQLTYQSGSGADTLWIRANDGTVWGAWSNAFTVTAPIDVGPTLTVGNLTATPGQSFTAPSLFSNYSDPFGSAATQYDFWDTGAGGGHFALNGTAQGTNQDNIITAAQLSQMAYVAGSGTDTLWVRANDGTSWGAWSNSFTVTG